MAEVVVVAEATAADQTKAVTLYLSAEEAQQLVHVLYRYIPVSRHPLAAYILDALVAAGVEGEAGWVGSPPQ